MVAHTYAHLHGLPATGLRFFTVYGPAGRPDMAYLASPKPSSKARRSKCLTKASSDETSPISMTLWVVWWRLRQRRRLIWKWA